MPDPLVSVLMPVYQAATTLRATLESLRAQSLARFEIVAVDDGSTDESAGILQAWRQTDPRLRVDARPHSGLTQALNHGLRLCSAPFVARLDADDVAAPERLAKQVEFLQRHGDVSVLGTRIECFPAAAVRQGYRVYEEWQNGLIEHDQIVREI